MAVTQAMVAQAGPLIFAATLNDRQIAQLTMIADMVRARDHGQWSGRDWQWDGCMIDHNLNRGFGHAATGADEVH